MSRIPGTLSLSLLIVFMCLSGCGGPTYVSEEESQPQRWEMVWVEPQLISATETYTLLRASRVDSVLFDPTLPPSQPVNSISFHVPFKPCRAAVSLIVARTMKSPLLDTTLSAGHYRLTLTSVGTPKSAQNHGSPTILLAEVCGKRTSRLLNSSASAPR